MIELANSLAHSFQTAISISDEPKIFTIHDGDVAA